MSRVFYHFMDGNNRKCLPFEKSLKAGNFEDVLENILEHNVCKNPYQSEEGALAWDRWLCLGQCQWTSRGLWEPLKISRREGEQKKE